MPRDKWTVGLVVTAVICVIIVLVLVLGGF